MKPRPIEFLAASLALLACSSSPGMSGVQNAGGDASAGEGGALLAAPAAGDGIQYEMMTTIAAGQEDERCKFVTVPSTGLWVNRQEVRFTGGSHHFVLWKTSYPSIPTQDTHGNSVDTSGVFECTSGPSASWNTTAFAGGAQAGNGPPLIDGLPAGTAVRFDPGAILIMDLHVLNPSAQDVSTVVRTNLWTVRDSQVTTEAGIYFFYDPFIVVPARSSASARMSCPVTSNLQLVNGQTHMHRRGLGGVANLVDGSGNLRPIYQSQSWEAVNVQNWAPGMAVQPGQSIDYQCNYQSTENADVMQGNTTKDEMCVFFGLYYPRDTKFETCSIDGTWPNLSTAATFIGTGTATCAATLQCIQSAAPTSQDHGDSLYGCVVNSCPKAAQQLTAVLDCQRSLGQGTCQSACDNGSSQCTSCIQQACQPSIAACQSATCN
jgi:copper type II ascorbate-dependent monooxygenase-like protein